ncbi:hypothetical protein [Streptomyces roseolilacinus]
MREGSGAVAPPRPRLPPPWDDGRALPEGGGSPSARAPGDTAPSFALP